MENKDLKFIPLEASIVGEPAHGYEVTDVIISPQFVEVTGPQSIIENTKKIYLEKIDVTELAKKESFTVESRSLNKLISVTEEGPYEVSVMIEPKQMERTIDEVPVNISGLKENFYLQEELLTVSVTLKGTVPVLENYVPAKRFVNLDLQAITEPGEYDLPLEYTVPSYLELLESSEETVHIIVLEKEALENSEGAEGSE